RYGLNSLKARWVEEYYWAYRRTFTLPADYVVGTPTWITFQRLEMCAVVYLNGQEVGRHANAHRPARFEVTKHLRPDGENTLVVLLDAGLFDVAEKPGAEYRDSPQARLTKIHWHRRGQWQRGWDWQQRLLNVGILGDVLLYWGEKPTLEQTQFYAIPSRDLTTADVHATLTVHNPAASPVSAQLHLTVLTTGDSATQEITLPSGESRHAVSLKIDNPQLWWPLGHGAPFQYSVQAIIDIEGHRLIGSCQLGIRRVEVDQSPHPVEGKYFTLKINNRPIFCKGGNWVPADMLHSTVTPERYRELIDLAVGANFNLLRIWGGGIYADPAFLDYCDRQGLLVWHDLLFACSKYPGDYPEFVREVRTEVRWAMREMAHHPSLVVWCGNNEIEEGDWHWGYDDAYRTHPHYAMFHHDLPQIAAQEAPHCFYWISSPYSPDYKSPRDPTIGDQHPWRVSLQMHGGADWWEYRTFVDRFPNEGGVLGCSTPATLRDFLPGSERKLLSATWEHHDNPFAIHDVLPGRLGHAYQTVQLWTGLDPLAMEMEEYAFISGLLQAEGITEYIANYRRRMFSSAAAIFWMYNSSWPSTHDWTIVDYYRRKRLAYHPVRRAFAPITAIAAAHPDTGVDYFAINDSDSERHGRVLFGTFAADGSLVETDGYQLNLPAHSVRSVGAGWGREYFTDHPDFGAFLLLYDESDRMIAQHRAFFSRFGDLPLVRDPQIVLTVEDGTLTLKSEVFCWGVCLDENGDRPVADNCFDLLPGISYSIPWDSSVLGEPRIARLGNHVF
ncbi:MAG: hypothetical protein SFU56_16710, partial [Capsulimonadales bacterium]|nr:hypothetical protein [Capsulimonadales bacterium]